MRVTRDWGIGGDCLLGPGPHNENSLALSVLLDCDWEATLFHRLGDIGF